MPKPYTRLSDAEREEISIGLEQSESLGRIGRRLGRPASTVKYERDRTRGKPYRAHEASRDAKKKVVSRRAGKTKMMKDPRLRAVVHEGLRKHWSPEQICRTLGSMDMSLSHETIYRYIYVLPRGSLKKTLIEGLRQERAYRRKNGKGEKAETRGKIADMLSIEERPREVADRTVPGHWEGDLIIGKYKQTAIGTLVERTTRYTIIVPLRNGKDAASVRKAFAKELGLLPGHIKKTLTYDQGKEMSQHRQFTIDTGIQVYFAHPGSPWERGTNENTNGLLRQYFPKGTDFDTISRKTMKKVQNEFNERPRKALAFSTPKEKFNALVALEM
ncbi:MAG: IS30 family transposase [Patescibacteria group bacterium]